jgi:undecaprenyl-diphosphatase
VIGVFLVTPVDDAVSEGLQAIRFQPLTWLLILASAWWVKSLLIPALGGIADLRRRVLPWTFVYSALAGLVAWPLASAIKSAVGRARPPLADHAVHAVGKLPHGSSFPSGHAATAFAAATVVALLRPGLRWPALGVASAVAFSRVYLGVHFLSDVLAGAALGTAVGVLCACVLRLAGWPSSARTKARSRQTPLTGKA